MLAISKRKPLYGILIVQHNDMLHVSATENMKTLFDELNLAKDVAAKTQGKLCIFH